MGKVTCSVCHRNFTTRLDGTVRTHKSQDIDPQGYRSYDCPGSGEKPIKKRNMTGHEVLAMISLNKRDNTWHHRSPPQVKAFCWDCDWSSTNTMLDAAKHHGATGHRIDAQTTQYFLWEHIENTPEDMLKDASIEEPDWSAMKERWQCFLKEEN